MMLTFRCIYIIVFFFLSFISFLYSSERKGMFLGASGGYGIDDVSIYMENQGVKAKYEYQKYTHYSFAFRFGGVLTPYILFGLDLQVMKKNVQDAELTFVNSTTSFWYFFNRDLFLKGGIGYGAATLSIMDTRTLEDGLGYIVGIGCEKNISNGLYFFFEVSYMGQGLINFSGDRFVNHSFLTGSFGVVMYKDI